MMEVDRPLFGGADLVGQNVVFILDLSGNAGKHLGYIQAAVQRALWSQIAYKQRFNLIAFTSIAGSVRAFAGRGSTLDSLRLALSYPETDTIVLCTGGSRDKDG